MNDQEVKKQEGLVGAKDAEVKPADPLTEVVTADPLATLGTQVGTTGSPSAPAAPSKGPAPSLKLNLPFPDEEEDDDPSIDEEPVAVDVE